MSDTPACDCNVFRYGDYVRHRLNESVFGIVTGDRNFGEVYQIRLAVTLQVVEFHGVELMHLPDADGDGGGGRAAEEPDNFTETNVIPFPNRKVAGSA